METSMIEPNTYFAPLDVHYLYPQQYIAPDPRFEDRGMCFLFRQFTIFEKPKWPVHWSYSTEHAESVRKWLPYLMGLDAYHCVNGVTYCWVLQKPLPLPNAKPFNAWFWTDAVEWRRVLHFCPELR